MANRTLENVSPSKETKTSKDLLDLEELSESSLMVTKKRKQKLEKDVKCPPQIFRPPPSCVLEQVRNFLPKMAEAQSDLENRLTSGQTEDLDIENVEGCEQVIQMTLSVMEQQTDDESDSEENDSDAEDIASMGPVTEETIKLPHPKKAPEIEIISTEESQS